ncbi:Rpn family recombination-promoting nuclease/putative transposase [Lysinibacillus sp. NPDC086135]|uniref:Rpn family recombination-promoting nuclease/putative transposase n=1 Tax=Lysinibacillus sp. NPDC086135 TaxID=3364130 RepID=UPI0037F5EC51
MSEKALRRIPLEKFVDLKVDYAFKQLFGNDNNKDITVVFLNAILNRTGRDAIKEVSFLSQEFSGEHGDDKQSRLDILVRTQENLMINVEIQLSNQYDMIKRTLFYWSRIYTSQLRKGTAYHKLRPTITINICNFSLFEQTDAYHTTFHLYEDNEKFRIDDVLEIHFIEMNKFIKHWFDNKLNPLDNVLARWLLLLGMVDARKERVYKEIYLELEELAMDDKKIENALTIWQELSQSPEEIFAYESRLKYILDEGAKLEDAKYLAEKEGLAKGIKQGIEQGIEQGEKKKQQEIALTMLQKGIDLETIAEFTELTLTEINKLKEQLD